jgi:pimeloyl-[acyl-carrier protein] methyl ester esterase
MLRTRLAASVLIASAVLHGSVRADGPATAPASPQKLFADSKVTPLGRFTVEVTGTGPDVILIPGLACSTEVWHHTADRLRAHYRVHLIQLAGFAGEPPRDNAAGPLIDPVVEAVDKYITENKLGPAVVIGHSLGGTITMRLAQQHPADVKKILLVDSLPFYSVLVGGPDATPESVKTAAESAQKQMSAPRTDASKARSKMMIGQMVTAPADVDRVADWGAASDPAVVGQAVYDDLMLDMRPGLAAMQTPVTLVYPFDAKMGVPLARWDDLYQTQFKPIPHKTLVRVDDSRHFVMYDQPEKFDAAVDAFLSTRD